MRNDDDQRMKELTDRLVAMSPEPPPFPEEVTMTTPARKTTMKPLTVFAAAAVVVLLGFGIPFLLLSGGEPPVASDSTTTTSNTTTSTPDETTTSDPDQVTTTATSLVDNVAYVRPVFLVTDSVNSFGGNPALVAFETTVYGSEDVEDLLLALHLVETISEPQANLPEGYVNAVPEEVSVNGIEYGSDFVVTIDMNEAFLDGAGGLLADYTMLNQLIYTATAVPDVTSVIFTVNGAPIEAFGSEGLDLSGPVDRESFEEHLALIYLTSPILPNQDGNIVVEGRSNTFEATLMMQVLDGSGEVAHEEFTTATCGTGCWGDFLFVLDSDLFEADSTVEVFEYSAENGERVNIVSIPYNGGELWDFLP
jgi:hypothetical protein